MLRKFCCFNFGEGLVFEGAADDITILDVKLDAEHHSEGHSRIKRSDS